MMIDYEDLDKETKTKMEDFIDWEIEESKIYNDEEVRF